MLRRPCRETTPKVDAIDSPHLYRQHGLRAGCPSPTLDAAIDQAWAVADRGREPILSLRHLGHLTGVDYRYLRHIVERNTDPYFEILQRSPRRHSSRIISSPQPLLMHVQRWLLRNVLSTQIGHPSSFAYHQRRSIVDCARRHLGAKWLVKLDLHDFFHSIDEARVYAVFREMGYQPLISLELSRVSTRVIHTGLSPQQRAIINERRTGEPSRYTSIPSYVVNQKGVLPQGAPTSGSLANLVSGGLDARLAILARKHGVTYTRYSDDLAFSASGSFQRTDAVILIRDATAIVDLEGFRVHRRKTRIVPPGARHVVLGLLVDGDRVRLLKETRRRIELHIRGVALNGLAQHAAHRRFHSVLGFVRHVDGLLAFAHAVDPEWEAVMRDRWREALRGSRFPVLG